MNAAVVMSLLNVLIALDKVVKKVEAGRWTTVASSAPSLQPPHIACYISDGDLPRVPTHCLHAYILYRTDNDGPMTLIPLDLCR